MNHEVIIERLQRACLESAYIKLKYKFSETHFCYTLFSQNSNPCLDPLFICLSVFANGYDFAVIFAYVIDTAESSSGVCLHSGVKLNRVILTQRRFICHRGVRSVFVMTSGIIRHKCLGEHCYAKTKKSSVKH